MCKDGAGDVQAPALGIAIKFGGSRTQLGDPIEEFTNSDKGALNIRIAPEVQIS